MAMNNNMIKASRSSLLYWLLVNTGNQTNSVALDTVGSEELALGWLTLGDQAKAQPNDIKAMIIKAIILLFIVLSSSVCGLCVPLPSHNSVRLKTFELFSR